jgi:hypothetical protein
MIKIPRLALTISIEQSLRQVNPRVGAPAG